MIGGGVGGLAASIALARSLHDVIVIDAGQPHNSPSAHAHNVLGHEGANPLDLGAADRTEAEDYRVRFVDGPGDTVLHRPCCHGCEVRGQSIAVIGTTAMSYHEAMMFSQLSERVTFIRHNAPEPDAEQENMLGPPSA